MKAFTLLLSLALALSLPCLVQAQTPPGINELYSIGGEMHEYYFHFSDLAFIIGAITGLLGGLRVYANWQAGQHHIDAQVSAWFFSCLFLMLCGVFLRGLFNF